MYIGPNSTNDNFVGAEQKLVSFGNGTIDTYLGKYATGQAPWQVASTGQSEPHPAWYSVDDPPACFVNFPNASFTVDPLNPATAWLIQEGWGGHIYQRYNCPRY